MFFLDEKGYITTKKQPRAFKDLQMVDRGNNSFELMTDAELIAEAKDGYNFASVLFFDIECYPNYFLCAFKSLLTGKVVYFELSPDVKLHREKLNWVLHNFNIISFNGNSYDIPMVHYALTGASTLQLKDASDQIIKYNVRASQLQKELGFFIQPTNHIDLIEVAPLAASLKAYGGRLHAPRLQDLPYNPHSYLTREQAFNTLCYCINDLDLTKLLYLELLPQIKLRIKMGLEYKQDLRSKSDAQVAETVISNEVQKINKFFAKRPKVEPGTVFKYNIPEFIQYKTQQLQKMLELVRRSDFVISNNGGFEMPEEIGTLKINIGSSVYRMGLGGLHSSEKCVSHKSDENIVLIDRDVRSYYPETILKLGLYPEQMGKPFLKVYGSIVKRRLEAKDNKDKVTADSLKITINGSFGKLGSMYSALYAPQLMIQVTITGQLALLMLIEAIEHVGIPVVSANTDGVIIKCPRNRENDLLTVIREWERATGYDTEETRYAAVYSRDVNNYIAVKYAYDEVNKVWLDEIEKKPKARFLDERQGAKSKGVFCERGSALNSVLSKNPEMLICNDAVIMLLTDNIPIEETITACKDIRRFISIKTVAGGGYKDDLYLGKVVRWYYAEGCKGEINYLTNGHKVGKSQGAKPLQDLPNEFPNDIDYKKYIDVTMEMLEQIGFYSNKSLSFW